MMSARVPRLRSMRRRAPRWGAGVVAAVAALALTGCSSIYDVPLPGGVSVSQPYQIHVEFRDVLDLVPQTTVKVDDVTVGKVLKVKLRGYTADVTISLPAKVKLPDNVTADIRQTSLLGEKFVSLSTPSQPSSGRLGSGDVIPLSRTGRNPEVEEVLSALALLLNGGGVGQLKTIASELNNAIGGREDEVRSVLDQIRSFTGQLADNKEAIVAALENLNRLSARLRAQEGTLKSALDNLPRAIASLNSQRADLVKTLQALDRLSDVGVRVIQQSKDSTIASLQDLSPVLEKLADAGQDLPDSIQVFLTFPFVDETVGKDPQVARNIKFGDYVNLSANLDIDLSKLNLPSIGGLPVDACTLTTTAVDQVNAAFTPLINAAPTQAIKNQLTTLKNTTLTTVRNTACESLTTSAVTGLLNGALGGIPLIRNTVCALLPTGGPANPLCANAGSTTVTQPQLTLPNVGSVPGAIQSGAGTVTSALPHIPGVNRTAPGAAYNPPQPRDPFGLAKYDLDPGIGTLLLQEVATRK